MKLKISCCESCPCYDGSGEYIYCSLGDFDPDDCGEPRETVGNTVCRKPPSICPWRKCKRLEVEIIEG